MLPAPDAPAPDAPPLDLTIADAPLPDAVVMPDMTGDAPAPPCTQVMGTPPLMLELVAGGFSSPVDIQSPPADPRLFIVEQGGLIRIIDATGTVLPTPFLDVSALVETGGNEEGLLGLAFHPDYATNGRFFVYYTVAGSTDNQVSEFLVSANPDIADDLSESVILPIPHPGATNHNGGSLNFGPNDGYLYIAVGDGGGSCDGAGNGQSLTTHLGKILRLDVDSATPYAIPMTNPFFGSLTQEEEIWAYGLRNPWRVSFDREIFDLYIGDVGQNEWEEIDVQPAASPGGENYGWDLWEASVCQDGSAGASCNSGAVCDPTGITFPIHEYAQATGSANCGPGSSASITGGYVYRGCRMPGYHGTYFYADYCHATGHSLEYSGGVATNLLDWPSLDTNASTFGQDYLGELYIADRNNGVIYRISPM